MKMKNMGEVLKSIRLFRNLQNAAFEITCVSIGKNVDITLDGKKIISSSFNRTQEVCN
jgi:hypothetical protein